MSLRDAQYNPGGGNDQSAAGSPPVGSQTSVREHAAQAGSTPTAGFEGTNGVLNYGG